MSIGPVVIGLVLLAANGFFVAGEFALLAARRSRIEQLAAEGSGAAGHALAGLRELSLMLAGAQLGITMASFGLGAVAEPAVHHGLELLFFRLPIPEAVSSAVSLVLALGIVVFLHMVVGEMAPKSWAISHPEKSALLLARVFRAYVWVFRPFIHLLNAMSNGVVRMCGVQPQDELAMTHSPAELALLLEESAQHGMLGTGEQDLLSRAIDLSGLDAESAMMPRGDIVAAPATATVDELEDVTRRSGRSRIPVYDGDLDRIRGVVHVKDLLAIDNGDRRRVTAGSLARPALVTPESRPVEDLMLDMRSQRQHVALVVDEYGTVTGLVALEDLLEELIGDITDESDRRGRKLRRRGDGSVILPATLRPDELEAQTGVELPTGDYETVAGYVITQLGRVPQTGDEVAVGGACLRVARMDGHRVVELTLRRSTAEPTPQRSG